MDLVSTFKWGFEYKPTASEILTHPNRYKRAESNFTSEEKDPHNLGQVVVWVKNLYWYIILYSQLLLTYACK